VTEQAKKDARDLWLPLGVVAAIVVPCFLVGVAWAGTTGDIKSQDQRITKLEIAVQNIAQTLDIDNYIEDYLRMFFFNDATPGSVLETDKELSKVAYDRLTVLLKTKQKRIKPTYGPVATLSRL
jgi:hypothetical protein